MHSHKRNDLLMARRRQLCQDMSRMAELMAREALAARDEIIAIDEELAGGKDE